MRFKEGEIVVNTPSDEYPDHTKTFVSLLTRMINKGIDNPAYQLHTLSLICTGKSFMELITKDSADAEQMLNAAKGLADGILDVIVQSGNVTSTTLDDIFSKFGDKKKGNDIDDND